MAISSTLSNDGKMVTIRVDGRFDFSTYQDFHHAYAVTDPAQSAFVIDMRKVDYIDSSALGMLLLLRERAGGDRSSITLLGCQPNVEQILDVSRFRQLFTMAAA